MNEILVKRLASGVLVPMNEEDLEVVQKIPVGLDFPIKIVRERSIGYHRRFYKLIRTVFKLQEIYPSVETMRDAILIAAGHCDTHVAYDGRPFYSPRRIDFDTVQEDEFRQIYSRCIDACLRHFVRGMTKTDLENATNAVLSFA